MSKISIKKLRENLPAWTARAAKGEVVLVTRYNNPYVSIIAAGGQGIHGLGIRIGADVGRRELTSRLKTVRATKGRWLEELHEDRED